MQTEHLTPPKSPCEPALNWNRLNMAQRDHMLSAWNQQSDHLSYPNSEVVHEMVDNFWERGWATAMPTLQEASKEALQDPSRFSRQLFYRPKTLACPFDQKYYYALHTKDSMREDEAIADLGNYLNFVSETAGQAGDEQVAEATRHFHDELGYLSEEDFEVGIEIIAAAWLEYLSQHPGEALNVYVPATIKDTVKSNRYVLNKVLESLAAQSAALPEEQKMTVLEKIKTRPEDWVDNAMLIVVDDWIISGQSCYQALEEAKAAAQANSKQIDPSKVEAHVIAMSEARDPSLQYMARAVYDHTVGEGETYRDVSMVGAHCTANYGYEHRIMEMQRYLQSKGIYVEAPHYFKLQPSEYRPEVIQSAYQEGHVIQDILANNKRVLRLLNNLSRTQEKIDAVQEHPSATEGVIDEAIMHAILRKGAITALLERYKVRRNMLRKELGMPKGI